MRSHRIIRVPILPFRMSNAYVLQGPGGCVLVDAGLPGSETKVERVLAREGLSLRDLSLIVVTHAHVDHAGAAARIRELSGARIVGHRGDLAHFRREAPMKFCPTGVAGALFYRTKATLEPYTPFTPDILLEGATELPLDAYGVPGARVVPTLGHTEGSISVLAPGGDALVGDMVASGILIGGVARLGHALRPPFEENPHAVARELDRLVDGGYTSFHLGHGGPLGAAEVRRHARVLAETSPSAPL